MTAARDFHFFHMYERVKIIGPLEEMIREGFVSKSYADRYHLVGRIGAISGLLGSPTFGPCYEIDLIPAITRWGGRIWYREHWLASVREVGYL